MWIVITVAALLIATVLIVAASKPDEFRIARSAAIGAPPEVIYPLIADFHRWTEWSPWETLDADLKRSYGGANSGTGATYAWQGRKAGAGQMEIVGVTQPHLISISLEFIKPFKASNMAEFAIRPDADGAVVTWTMTGKRNLLAKVMGTFLNLDKMVGKDFETGLANLKKIAER